MFEEQKEDRTFISLGNPRGLAMTSLNKYIAQRKQIKPTPLLPPKSPSDNPAETIAQLQNEQSILCEELNAERRRNENLSATFKCAQSLSQSQYLEKLNAISTELSKSEDTSKYVKEALNIILNIIDQETHFQPGKLKAASGTPIQSHDDENDSKFKKENEKIDSEIQRLTQDKEAKQKQLEELELQIEKMEASRQELVAKSKHYYETYKKRDAAWKEKVQKMKEQIQQPQ
ncbi:hypothetical protein TVAG_354730 [Trichomonas vaginalis G3]|uniref:Uncharacterized protein n=1 Tax=Trichomonas vaginalis (strain ATCC PRA-98 / G3) TaxID=412133 RepID=A2EFV8_TRIV3|nr:hypothetical protein TVAGG3_0516300 [Trichomonas vaginalis G3]EAY08414.1 hypothetical protein TVAG_354730 [Trichomonas vaginalis G3]KAI5518154.1 hypothetical protein TVAGG3_0516300 [Trichomonas vaginalis G3]|eukprot:XP_001320637.1 hypothetical protein [Trichomonas vaginalis G3]